MNPPKQERMKRMRTWTGYQVVDADGGVYGEVYWTRGSALAFKKTFACQDGLRIARVIVTESPKRRRRKA